MKVGYVRVSTREQEESNALDQQTARVQKAGAVKIFCDVQSGRSDKRPQFNQLLRECKQGLIKEIIITRVDRLGRSVITLHKAIALFTELKIKLTILDSPVDGNSPFGWLSISQMAMMAEFESRMLAERINNGMEYFREQKKASSRPPFGYYRLNEKYSPDLEEINNTPKWEIALRTIEYFLAENTTLRNTCIWLLNTYGERWTASGLRYWLLNPVLRGHTAYHVKDNKPEDWELHYNTHEPLISDQTFNQILSKLEENRTKYAYGKERKRDEVFPLAGQILCGSCGYRCFCKKRKFSTYPIRCKKRDTLGASFCTNQINTPLPEIIKKVDLELVKRYQEIENYRVIRLDAPKILSPELAALQEQLTALRAMKPSPAIKAAIDQTVTEINVLKQKELVTQQENNELHASLAFVFSNFDYWQDVPWEDKAKIYKELVESVTVLNGEVLDIKLRV